MFNQFLKKADALIAEAKKSKHVIQEHFFPIYKTIEDYVRQHNLIVSNVETLIKQDKTVFSEYIIYGDHIFRHANNLCNELAKINIYTLMYTNVKNEDFSITVDGSRLIQLFNIQNKFKPTIIPVKINNMNIYPPEFELIEIYHKLYLPNYAEEWEKIKSWEIEIRKQMYERKKILGGYQKHQKHQKQKSTRIDNSVILNWLKGRRDYVLIGINAVNILLGDDRHYQKIQIITSSSIEKITSEFSNLIFQFFGYKTHHKTHSAHLSTEPRLQKTVVSVTIPDPRHGKKTIHLLDIFNSATYELVPYTTYEDLDIGYKNVLRMFFLIDFWFLRTLHALNFINDSSLKKSANIVFDYLEKIDEIKDDKYSREVYLGVYINLMRYKQKQGTQNVFWPYYPEQHRYIKGDYRKV